MLTAAPSVAATYSWPVQITQPVNVSNLTFSATSELVVVCGISTGSNTPPIVEGTTEVPIRVPPSGVLTYTGNVVVSVGGPSQTGSPQAGNYATCTLREKTAGQFTNVGSASSLKLP
jgi:hypothetical protein